MFYAYVRQLPMVDGNAGLFRGNRLNFTCGSLRRAKADLRGFRAFVLEDKRTGVRYRVVTKGMVVEHDLHGPTFIRNPDKLKYTPFAVEGEAAEVNSFLSLCDRMVEEHKQRNSFIGRWQRFTRDPIGKVIIGAGLLYAVATAVVLMFG